MEYSTWINVLGKQHEQDALADSLGVLSDRFKNAIEYPEMPVRSAEESEYWNSELQQSLLAPLPERSTAVSSAMRRVHEASRTERDFEILHAGRKKLLKGCLDAAVWRWEKLGRQIKAIQTGEKI